MTEIERIPWRRRLLYASLTGATTVVFIVIMSLVWRAFLSDPPFYFSNTDPDYTEPLCPGEQLVINNRVVVDRPVVLFFYLSVMDKSASRNINDTQVSFPGRIHPHSATFHQLLPWTVPDLEPGEYILAIAGRGTDGDENPVIVLKKFSIAEEEHCANDPTHSIH